MFARRVSFIVMVVSFFAVVVACGLFGITMVMAESVEDCLERAAAAKSERVSECEKLSGIEQEDCLAGVEVQYQEEVRECEGITSGPSEYDKCVQGCQETFTQCIANAGGSYWGDQALADCRASFEDCIGGAGTEEEKERCRAEYVTCKDVNDAALAAIEKEKDQCRREYEKSKGQCEKLK